VAGRGGIEACEQAVRAAVGPVLLALVSAGMPMQVASDLAIAALPDEVRETHALLLREQWRRRP